MTKWVKIKKLLSLGNDMLVVGVVIYTRSHKCAATPTDKLRLRGHSPSVSLTNTDTQRNVAHSDPFHVAENEDEQGPEENSYDSSPDENHNLHAGLVAWTLAERQIETIKLLLDADCLNAECKPFPFFNLSFI